MATKTKTQKITPTTETESKAPAFDFGTVEVTEAEKMPKTTRNRGTAPNPFLDVMRASLENDYAPKQITIPTDAVKQAQSMIRRAADDLECGSRIVVKEVDEDTSTVYLSAKQRRKYTPRSQ